MCIRDSISSSSVYHQFIISSSSVHQFIISSSSVHHQFIISSSSVHHQFIVSSSSVHRQFIVSSSSVHHQSYIFSISFVFLNGLLIRVISTVQWSGATSICDGIIFLLLPLLCCVKIVALDTILEHCIHYIFSQGHHILQVVTLWQWAE